MDEGKPRLFVVVSCWENRPTWLSVAVGDLASSGPLESAPTRTCGPRVWLFTACTGLVDPEEILRGLTKVEQRRLSTVSSMVSPEPPGNPLNPLDGDPSG
jgi:hypothetical protein